MIHLDAGNTKRGPETAGGKAFEFVYEYWRPQSVDDDQAKRQERGKYQDFLAEATADTLAILPRYGPIAAGIARAGVLIKPSESILQNSQDFALNFAQGAALRKVATFASPDLNSKKLNAAGMAGTFLLQGVSFGAIKGGFHKDSWFNENAEFSVRSGLWNVSSSGLYAGLLNVPAGFLGSKIASTVIETTTRSGLGVRASLVGGGLVSGYGTGFVIGGSNAFLEGKSGLNLLEASNDAALLSAATGAAIMSTTKLRFSAIERSAAQELENLARFSSKYEKDTTADPDFFLGTPNLSKRLSNSLEMRNRNPIPILDHVAASDFYSTRTINTAVLKDGVSLSSVPLRYDFLYRAVVTRKEAWETRVYHDPHDATGLGPVFVKNDYAQRLNADARAGQLSGGEPHHMEIKHALSLVPDPSLVKEAYVRPDTNIHTPWHQKASRNPTMVISATADSSKGQITFTMRKETQRDVHNVTDHEWAHLLESKVKEQRALFDLGVALERRKYAVSDYARTNSGENWAEHTASFLGNPWTFAEFVHNAPLRAIPLAQGLSRAVQNIEQRAPGFTDPGLLARLKYTEGRILPQAITELHFQLNSLEKMEAARAALMLGAIGKQADLDVLANLAANSKFLKTASYDALLGRMNSDQYKFDGYKTVRIGNGERNLRDFLAFHANPANRSFSRNLALEGLSTQSLDSTIAGLNGQELRRGNKQFSEFLYLIVH